MRKDSAPQLAVSAVGRAKGDRKTVMTDIDIEPTENGGFSVRKNMRYEPTTGTKGEYLGYPEPHKFAFSSKDELIAWIKKEL